MDSFLDEFQQILELPSFRPVVAAMAKLANALEGHEPSGEVSSASTPGMSVRCTKCGAKNGKNDLQVGKCRSCGNPLHPMADFKAQAAGKDPRYRDDNEEMSADSDSGAKGAGEEGSSESNSRVSKTANVAALNAAKGTAAIAGGLWGANELNKLIGGKKERRHSYVGGARMRRLPPKLAAAAPKHRGANPILRIRKKLRGKPSAFVEALRDKQRGQ